MADPRDIVPAYCQWLQEGATTEATGDWVVVTLPFLDRHNDHLQIFVRHPGGGFVLSDDGSTLGDLELSGVELSPGRREFARSVARKFGVAVQGSELTAPATAANLPEHLHALLQAMLAIGHQGTASRRAAEPSFPAQVKAYLESLHLPVRRGVRLKGRSGLAHQFDYALTDANGRPSRVIAVIDRDARGKLRRVVLGWNDVRERGDVELLIVVAERAWPLPPTLVELCLSNDVRAVPWSSRDQIAAGLM